MPSSEPLLVLVGPTASGKSALAMQAAEHVGGEVISADSVQIYRRFDIGSGKVTVADRKRVPHHLVDAIEPDAPMDAATWAGLAVAAVHDVRSRGRVPIVCGGTFLWVRALIYGLSAGPAADAEIRARHRVLVEAEGRSALHAKLGVVDPVAAARLSPNDFVRVSRALEVFELSGKPQSAWHDAHGFREPLHAARFVGVRFTPDQLSTRIVERAQRMFDGGWVDEVRALIQDGFDHARPMKSVGYRQIAEAVRRGVVNRATVLEEVVRATRVFARRQRTWLRDETVEWLDPAAAASFRG
jgi:tRNA dimethylallyltransferase